MWKKTGKWMSLVEENPGPPGRWAVQSGGAGLPLSYRRGKASADRGSRGCLSGSGKKGGGRRPGGRVPGRSRRCSCLRPPSWRRQEMRRRGRVSFPLLFHLYSSFLSAAISFVIFFPLVRTSTSSGRRAKRGACNAPPPRGEIFFPGLWVAYVLLSGLVDSVGVGGN